MNLQLKIQFAKCNIFSIQWVKKGQNWGQSLCLGFCKFGDSEKTNDIAFIYFNMAIVSLIQILLHSHILVLHLDLITCFFTKLTPIRANNIILFMYSYSVKFSKTKTTRLWVATWKYVRSCVILWVQHGRLFSEFVQLLTFWFAWVK